MLSSPQGSSSLQDKRFVTMHRWLGNESPLETRFKTGTVAGKEMSQKLKSSIRRSRYYKGAHVRSMLVTW